MNRRPFFGVLQFGTWHSVHDFSGSEVAYFGGASKHTTITDIEVHFRPPLGDMALFEMLRQRQGEPFVYKIIDSGTKVWKYQVDPVCPIFMTGPIFTAITTEDHVKGTIVIKGHAPKWGIATNGELQWA